MMGTRRVSKRLSEKKVELMESTLKSKKRKVQSKKSIYFDPGGSSDKDFDKDSYKKEADSTTRITEVEKVADLTFSNNIKNEDLSDSDSSSDEFKKAPFSLDELGGFEIYKKDSVYNKDSIQNENSITASRLSDDSDIEEKPQPDDNYYDFSQIIKTQELITTMKKEFDEVKREDQIPSTSKVSLHNLKQKKVKQREKTPKEKDSKIDSGVNNLDVSQLLAMAEGSNLKCNEAESDESQSEETEVKDKPISGVEVTIQLPNMRKKKSTVDVEAAMKRRINLVRKENQILMHQVHLLCWIAHGNYLNGVLNNDELMGLSLSLIPSQHCYPPKHTNLNYLEKLVEWFRKKILVNENEKSQLHNKLSTTALLQQQINLKTAFSFRDLVLIFVCMLRSLGIHSRLVINLRAVPLKPPASELFVVSTKPKTEENASKNQTKTDSKKVSNLKTKKCSNKKESSGKSKTNTSSKVADVGKKPSKTKGKSKCKKEFNNSPYFSSSDEKPLKNIDQNKPSSSQHMSSPGDNVTKKENTSQYFSSSDEKPLKKKVDSGGKGANHACDGKQLKEVQSSSKLSTRKPSNNTKDVKSKPKLSNIRTTSRERRTVPLSYIERSSSSSEDESKGESSRSKKLIKNKKVSNKGKTNANKVTTGKNDQHSSAVKKKSTFDDSDDNFEPPSLKKQRKSSNTNVIDRRVLSSDDEDDDSDKKIGVDYWVEVFLEEEEKWISVDLTHGRVHCIHKIYNLATKPVRYILAWNNDKTIKDITRRYTPHWLTVTRKQRVNQDWWEDTLAPFAPLKNAREREEDDDLDRQLQDKPLPSSISEYKNHPLYALKRHLLKFEAIYPDDAPAVGFVRSEPVYSRACVVGLHTRETWIKEAKCVRVGEEPYKIVKARPKYDKLSGNVINNLPLPLFGYWQVEDYIPPPAEDGKVPRNEYGNVELYKPCMLPPGTVHLQIPGLNRVARKLNIDCAPAVVGWDFHCGASHPVLDGFVVCEEFRDTLLDAWNQEIDESARRAKEKVEQRVYGNWKRLIKGLLIRERLKLRYDFGPVSAGSDKTQKKKTGHHKRK